MSKPASPNDVMQRRIRRNHRHYATKMAVNELREALGQEEFHDEPILGYQTAIQRHRRKQHMMIFDGFHSVN